MQRARLIAVTSAVAALAAVPVVRALAGTERPSTLPACAQLGQAISRPAAIPSGFPLPDGTRITQVTTTGGGSRLVLGFAPLGLRDARNYFEREVPDAGYRHTGGDAEPWEAEARFVRGDLRGLWRVNVIRGCPRAVVVTLGFLRA